jgi:hypothetical protein
VAALQRRGMEQEHPLVFGDGDAAPAVPKRDATHAAMERQTAAVQKILKALAPLPPEGQMRVIRAAAALFGISLP